MVERIPHTYVSAQLKLAGLRPTRQRLALAKLLFETGKRHVTAEQLYAEARNNGIKVSLATVYNTLNQFTKATLLREVVVETGRTYFDTNTANHHHIFNQDTGELWDIPHSSISNSILPKIPEDMTIDRIDVIIRLKRSF